MHKISHGTNHFCVKIRQTLPLNPIPVTNESTFLTFVSTQAVPARSKKKLQCDSRNEDGSKNRGYEGRVTSIETLGDSCGLWVAQTLVRDNEGICWIRLLDIHFEVFVTYKNSWVGMLAISEIEHQGFFVLTKAAKSAEKNRFQGARLN